MTKEQAKFLVDVTENAGNQDISLREGYSGRGMCGRETCAVVVNSLTLLLCDCINHLKNEDVESINLVPDFNNLRTDSMGRESIVIY